MLRQLDSHFRKGIRSSRVRAMSRMVTSYSPLGIVLPATRHRASPIA